MWNLKKPVISAIQGYCLGGEFELAMACDFAYADTSAELGEPEILLSDAPPFLIGPWVMGFAPETWHQNKSAVNRSYEIMGFQSCVEMGKEAFVTANVTPNSVKAEFLERFNRDGFSKAIKWLQTRYAD